MVERHHWKLLFPQVHYHFRNTGSTIPLHLFFLADKATWALLPLFREFVAGEQKFPCTCYKYDTGWSGSHNEGIYSTTPREKNWWELGLCTRNHIWHLKCFLYRPSAFPAQCNTLPAQVHRDFLLLLDICYKLKRTPYIIGMRLAIQAIWYALKILSWEFPWEKGTL